MWEISLWIPSWLLTFFGVSQGLYIVIKIEIRAYLPTEPQITLQALFYWQALGHSDLQNNPFVAGQTVIVYFWPTVEFQELEENPFVPLSYVKQVWQYEQTKLPFFLSF